jgi:hypothetical protein
LETDQRWIWRESSLAGGLSVAKASGQAAARRCVAWDGLRWKGARYENKQLAHRLPVEFVRNILSDFNAGSLDAVTAASHLGVGRSRLYELRTAWLRERSDFAPKPSGGDQRTDWPPEVQRFLLEFLPLQNPPNYQLVADELQRLCGWVRARSSVEAHVKAHYAHLLPSRARQPRVYRRFRRAHIGELWQHDSSIHQWWPAPAKQTLLLTVDDHSGLNLAGRFVESDTTWNHFEHFREAFETWGLPQIVYTDGLSLFGPSSSHDHSDPKSEFQRAFRGLGVAHLVAPTPQAKGKIERRFGTFQRRLVTLLAHARAETYQQSHEVLQMEISRQNRSRNRILDKAPLEIWDAQSQRGEGRMRSAPPAALLDLHFSLRCSRRVNHDHTIDFEGQNYEIASTLRKTVTLVHHPLRRFWITELPPTDVWPTILAHFTL